MKRRTLIRHLRDKGCTVLSEGGDHTIVLNPATNQQASVPRHREIDSHLARGICKQLDVPAPRGR
jgi:hypothetical protein